MKILIFAGLSDHKLWSKIQPILEQEKVNEVYLVRKEPFSYHHAKLRTFAVPGFLKNNLILREGYRILLASWLILRKRPHYLIGFYFFLHGLYALLLGKIFRCRSIVLFLGTDLFWEVARSSYQKVWLRLLACAFRIGVRGENGKKWLEQQGFAAEKIFIPANHYDFSQLPSAPSPSGEKTYDLIMIAGINQEKRVDILLQAVAEVKKSFPEVRLALVGDGPLRSEMEKLAEQWQIQDSVDFLGYQNPVFPLLAQSKIFIMTSRQEGLPVALIEALSMGVPAIVPDIGDITTVAYDHHNALVVRPLVVADFVAAIEKLLGDSQLREKLAHNALRIREEKQAEYSLAGIKKQWQQALL